MLYKDCYAHVISRSIRKMKIFNHDEDYEKFKELLLAAKQAGKFKIFHYCIMQTHFHLAVEMKDIQGFSYAMRDLKRSYVYWFHRKYKISGPVWRERFRSLLIEDERYLLACGRYIEENPVKAGMIEKASDWKYSSSRYYEQSVEDELVDGYQEQVEEINDLELNEEEFEDGSVIGSGFFKFQFLEGRKGVRRVP